MTSVLLAWTSGLQLSHPVRTLEEDFRNGYLFGEILNKYNQQHDFIASFRNTDRADDIIRNYTCLQPTFARLGIKFNRVHLDSMIKGAKGVAARVLYEIKTKLESIEKVQVGRPLPETSTKVVINLEVRDGDGEGERERGRGEWMCKGTRKGEAD